MARARNIKPSFFTNDELADCQPLARLLFISLWTLADREGRLEDRPKRIKGQTFPYDDCDCEQLLNELEKHGFILRYEVNGNKFIQITNFVKHQNPHHKEIASIIPPPENHKNSVCDGYIPLSNTIRNKIKERDGNKCNYCGSVDMLEIDHIIPISRGGNSTEDNLQVLCKSCNSAKSNHIVNHKESIKQKRVVFNENSNQPQSIDNSITNQHQSKHDSSMNQGCFKESASYPTDSLNLIPDSPILIPSHSEPDANASAYAFSGLIIKLNQKHFDEWKSLYPKIDLNHELKRLDLEFQHDKPKNWFVTASQKLNYQNKQVKPNKVNQVSKGPSNPTGFRVVNA